MCRLQLKFLLVYSLAGAVLVLSSIDMPLKPSMYGSKIMNIVASCLLILNLSVIVDK